ncbi:MAG: hypothetical protein JWO78_1798 [Micavibrio sp.]|nr:hypothetical protein [Micavibrio sp.]
MDLSSLSGLFGGNTPSLLDYMEGGKMSGTATNSTALSLLNNGLASDSGSGDTVSLSPEAQQILARLQGTSSDSGGSATGVTKAAQNFIGNFFTASGVDVTKMSDQAQKLLQGFQDLVADSGATTRDTTTDTQEARYNNGNRQVYTLVGDGRRIRIAVDYADGKPASMTMTDISSDGKVISAKVNMTPATGTVGQGLDVAETQYQYSSGILRDSVTKPVISMDLYKAAT